MDYKKSEMSKFPEGLLCNRNFYIDFGIWGALWILGNNELVLYGEMQMMNKLFFQAMWKFVLGVVLVGLLIFLPAGTFLFFNGWLFMAILFIPMFIAGIVMLVKNPELLEKRLDAKEKMQEQRLVVKLSGLMFLTGFVIAGLGVRLDWYSLPKEIVFVASGVFLIAYLLYAEVLRENTYLSRTIEVQENQKVIDTGLYGIVRHPMYSATLLLFLAMPLVLGSLYSFFVFLIYPFIIAQRIISEEAFLEKELIGYLEYKKRSNIVWCHLFGSNLEVCVKEKKVFYSEIAYIAGMIVLSLGTAFMERADFGMSMVVAPAYLIHLKVAQFLPFFSFGMSGYVFQAVLLCVLSLIMRRVKKSYFLSFVTAFLYGIVLDIMMKIVDHFSFEGIVWHIVLFIAGLVICAVGISLLFHTYFPPEAYELFVKEISQKTNMSLGKIKTIYDCCSCVLGVILSLCFSGTFVGVKWGTVVCAMLNGWLIGGMSRFLEDKFVFKAGLPLENR